MAIGPRIGARLGARVGPRIGSPSGGTAPVGPTVTLDKFLFTAGEMIQVSWTGATTPLDYLNQALVGSPDTTITNYMYCNSGTAVAGGATQASGTRPMSSLVAGTYEMRLLTNDSFTVVARSAPFTVT